MWRAVVLPAEQTPEELTRLAPDLARLEMIDLHPTGPQHCHAALLARDQVYGGSQRQRLRHDRPPVPSAPQAARDLSANTRERHEQRILTFKILVLPDDDAPPSEALTIFSFPLDDIPPMDDYEEREMARYEKLWEGWLKCTKGMDVS